MRTSRLTRLFLIAACLVVARDVRSQQPFDLDTTFRAPIDTWYVSSIAPLPDGRVFLSGMMHFPNDPIGSFRGGAMLLPNGSRDVTFPNFPLTIGAGKVTSWNGQYYVATTQTVRRLDEDCIIDPAFISMNNDPLFSSLQGGDYHVYPDGRILMSGVHQLLDSIRGYEGLYCLCWFSNTGYLDTTKTHRQCAGSLDFFRELPDGKFIGSLGNPPNTASWEGTPTGSNVIRFNADGEWDSTFQANVWWGTAYRFLPLADGRVYASGAFRITGITDTLRLVRFMPDGSLDLTFNNYLNFQSIELSGSAGAVVGGVLALDEGRLIVTGAFELVEGESRQGICLIDTSGNLLNDYFNGPGCGDYTYQSFTYGGTEGIVPAPDGSYYIWGAYHGYDDGTTNDTLQRMVSRLYGFNVGLEDKQGPQLQVTAHPNPGGDHIWFNGLAERDPVQVGVFDARGVLVLQAQVQPNEALGVSGLNPGFYVMVLRTEGGRVHRVKWVKE